MRNKKNSQEGGNLSNFDGKESLVVENSSPSTVNVHHFFQKTKKPSLSAKGLVGSSSFDPFDFFSAGHHRTKSRSMHLHNSDQCTTAAAAAASAAESPRTLSPTRRQRRPQEPPQKSYAYHDFAPSSHSFYNKRASLPIPCPLPKDTLEESELDRGLTEIYNQATWNMYHRIRKARVMKDATSTQEILSRPESMIKD
mmetsp:Transcript_14849/g.27914  ORF Transcript_14849/g.27914 Transcript_14849/m.27914 type:complete len:197 (+) Transcript_14849:63-653(+)